jgi:hypothetical protein
MTNSFFKEQDSTIPNTSNYLKLVEGTHKFRILGSAIVGWEFFNEENKPVRSREPFDETPNIKTGGDVKKFWMFPVYNYDADRIQLLEVSQKSIQGQMKDYIDNPDWGTPEKGEVFEYDFTIIRKGTTKNDTEYKVITSPHEIAETMLGRDASEKVNIIRIRYLIFIFIRKINKFLKLSIKF